jgi:nicotinamidase-related amidase
VDKPRWGAFYETPPHALLHELGVDTVIVAGCNLPNCVRATRGALGRLTVGLTVLDSRGYGWR